MVESYTAFTRFWIPLGKIVVISVVVCMGFPFALEEHEASVSFTLGCLPVRALSSSIVDLGRLRFSIDLARVVNSVAPLRDRFGRWGLAWVVFVVTSWTLVRSVPLDPPLSTVCIPVTFPDKPLSTVSHSGKTPYGFRPPLSTSCIPEMSFLAPLSTCRIPAKSISLSSPFCPSCSSVGSPSTSESKLFIWSFTPTDPVSVEVIGSQLVSSITSADSAGQLPYNASGLGMSSSVLNALLASSSSCKEWTLKSLVFLTTRLVRSSTLNPLNSLDSPKNLLLCIRGLSDLSSRVFAGTCANPIHPNRGVTCRSGFPSPNFS